MPSDRDVVDRWGASRPGRACAPSSPASASAASRPPTRCTTWAPTSSSLDDVRRRRAPRRAGAPAGGAGRRRATRPRIHGHAAAGHRPGRDLARVASDDAAAGRGRRSRASRSGARSSWPGACVATGRGAVAGRHRHQRQDHDRADARVDPAGRRAARAGRRQRRHAGRRGGHGPAGRDVLAVELSSFQLHWTHSMSAQAAAVLNLAPDHYDWHGGADAYAAAKGKVYERTQLACVYNVADEATMRLVEEADVVEGARAIGFTLGDPRGRHDRRRRRRCSSTGRSSRTRATSAAELGSIRLADLDDASPHNVEPTHSRPRPWPGRTACGRAPSATACARFRLGAAPDRDGRRDRRRPLGRRLQGHQRRTPLSRRCRPSTHVVWVAGGLAKGATYFDELVARRPRPAAGGRPDRRRP